MCKTNKRKEDKKMEINAEIDAKKLIRKIFNSLRHENNIVFKTSQTNHISIHGTSPI